jgi:hypothetical protein
MTDTLTLLGVTRLPLAASDFKVNLAKDICILKSDLEESTMQHSKNDYSIWNLGINRESQTGTEVSRIAFVIYCVLIPCSLTRQNKKYTLA